MPSLFSLSFLHFNILFSFFNFFSYLNLHIDSKVGRNRPRREKKKKKEEKEKRDNKIERVLTSVWTSASHHITNINQTFIGSIWSCCFSASVLALSSLIVYACTLHICHHIAPFETVGRLHKRRQYEKFQNKAVTRRHASFEPFMSKSK